MVLLFLPYIVQILLIFHAIRNGKNTTWIWLLIMVPYVGGLIYFAMEILPDLRNGRLVNLEDLVGLVDRNASVRRLKEEIEISDTPANRIALADEFFRLGDYSRAQKAYREELKGIYSQEATLQRKVATSSFHLGDFETANEYFHWAHASRPTTSTEILSMAAYCQWEVARDAETLAELERLFEVNKTSDAAAHLCRAYGKLGNLEGVRAVVRICERQLTRLRGKARSASRARIEGMKAELQ